MLALQRQEPQKRDKCTMNILPCRIHYDGPTKVTKRYWNPVSESDATKTSYFRGRKLRGRSIKIAEGYEGIVVDSTDKFIALPTKATSRPTYTQIDDDIEIEEEEDEPPEPVRILQEVSTFDEVVVWGHDAVPDADNAFVRGVQDWIGFAEALHGKPPVNEKPGKETEEDDKETET